MAPRVDPVPARAALPSRVEVVVIGGGSTSTAFFIATGFSGHGFGIGPGAGRLMADLVSGAAPVVDPAPYRFSRFSDGSRIEIITGF